MTHRVNFKCTAVYVLGITFHSTKAHEFITTQQFMKISLHSSNTVLQFLPLTDVTIGFDPVVYTVSEDDGAVNVSASVRAGQIQSGTALHFSLLTVQNTAVGECCLLCCHDPH